MVSNLLFLLQLDAQNRLIGEEILSLAETDVPVEDLVFHKFYMNKMNSTRKSTKKKKKKAADDAAEELYDINDQGDESDNEEIDNILDSTNPPLEAADGGEYDYDDLDEIANEDDDDLVDDNSDEEAAAGVPSDIDSEPEEVEDAGISFNEDDDSFAGEADDDDGREENISSSSRKKKRKQKPGKNTGKSPFASAEDYEHLLNEENPESNSHSKPHKSKKKKRRTSK